MQAVGLVLPLPQVCHVSLWWWLHPQTILSSRLPWMCVRSNLICTWFVLTDWLDGLWFFIWSLVMRPPWSWSPSAGFFSDIWLAGRVEQWWRIHIHVSCIPDFPRDIVSASSPVFSCLSSIQSQSWTGRQVSQTGHLWQRRFFWFIGHGQSSTSGSAVQEHTNSGDRPFSSAAFTASAFAGFCPCSALFVSTTSWVIEGFSPPWNSPCQGECKVDWRLW